MQKQQKALGFLLTRSVSLGRLLGIEVFVHSTFLLLLGVVVIAQLAATRNPAAAVLALLTMGVIFLCVLLHEYGHALVARSFGIPTKRITLLPIGGVAQIERMPEKPREELLIALAGPAVNLVLALGALPVLAASFLGLPGSGPPVTKALFFFMVVNVLLGSFNLLPALPMDGGRVLRSVLSMRMNPLRATEIAARIGKLLAIGMGLFGLFFNPLLLFIAAFVWFGANQELTLARARTGLKGASVRNAMATDFHTLSPEDSLRTAADLTVRSAQRHYPVVFGGRVVGVLLHEDLMRSLPTAQERLVADVMRSEFETVQPTEALESIFGRLFGSSLAALPVLDDSRLVGLITRENLQEFLALRRAWGRPSTTG